MDLAAVQEVVRQAVISTAGVTDVQWAGSARAARFGKGPQVDLVLRNVVTIGVDETRRTFDVDTDQLLETQSGLRQMTVGVRIEANTQKPGENAQAYAMRMRARLRRPDVISTMRDGTVALVDILPTAIGDYRDKENRVVSLAVTDLLLATVENDANEAAAGDYIATVEIASNLLTHTDESPGAVQIALEVSDV